MIQSEIINTGSELLLGLVQNTHLTSLALGLAPLGIDVERQLCVPDGPAIREALDEALNRAEVVFLTGGLGPTSDDISRESAAELLDLRLQLDEHVLKIISDRFSRRKLVLTDNNRRQAMVPCGARFLPNDFGTAPGLYFSPDLLSSRRARHLFLLPGPPRELQPMFDNFVVPILREALPSKHDKACRIYKFTGIGESQLENRIGSRIEARGDITVGYCARPSEVDLRLIAPQHTLDEVDAPIRSEVGDCIYSLGDSLEQTVVDLLRSQHLTLSTAESCTGGKLSHRITNISGASDVFLAGIASYANSAKHLILGIPMDLIESHGAVSKSVAAAMAEGARRVSGSHLALSTTGIAGPTGGSADKPVGTVFIALAAEGSPTIVRRYFFPMDRITFKQVTSTAALDLLRRHLLRLPLPEESFPKEQHFHP